MSYTTINSMKMPMIGLGTYKIKGHDLCYEVIDNALKIGYRAFDSAQVYKNESDIGESLEKLLPKYKLKREEIFITTKIATYNHADLCYESVKMSLKSFKTDYFDLVLIHWPGVKGLKLDDEKNSELRRKTWEQLEKLHSEGAVKYIGVSNYTVHHLNELLSHAKIVPHLLQSEFHPLLNQKELVEFCRNKRIVFQAYSSLGTSDKSLTKKLVENPTVVSIAQKYSKSPAQVLLKWSLQQNIAIIPKATSYLHLKENMDIFDFIIDEKDMELISSINQNEHLCWNPNTVS